MEHLWEKGKMVFVQAQRGTMAATAHCLSAGICIPVALRERMSLKNRDHPLHLPRLRITTVSGKVCPK